MEDSERGKTLREAETAYVAKSTTQSKLETNAAAQADIKQVIDPGAIPVPLDDFLLAWEEMDCTYAVIHRTG